jgi:predicted permease
MGAVIQDFKYALRMLRKAPAFTAIAVITLALGIGANTAIFSVVNSVLLKPLPYPEPDRLVSVSGLNTRLGEKDRALSFPDIEDLQKQNSVFEYVSAYTGGAATITGAGEPLHVPAAVVSADTFSVLKVMPILGRTFAPGEDRPGNYVAILSSELWKKQFDGDPSVIGRAVALDGRSYTIIGVMPAGFAFPLDSDPPQIWTTLSATSTSLDRDKAITEQRGAHFLASIARLKPGVTLERANSEIDALGARLAKAYPDSNSNLTFRAQPALDALVGDLRPQIRLLFGAVGLVLLIGCANVANLLLARSTSRQREFAIRAALGAGRPRIVRQLLIESGILALAGGTFGLLIATWGSSFLAHLAGGIIPRIEGSALDARVLAFTFFASIATAILFGIAPALQLSKLGISDMLKEGSRGSGRGAHHNFLRNALVVAETTLAVILLSGAGLLIRSLVTLEHVNPGFDPHGVITFTTELPDPRYPKPEMAEAFYRQLFERIRALPGVQSASGVLPLPLSDSVIRTSYEIEGHPVAKAEEPLAHMRIVSTDYFSVMRIPLVKGRFFTEADRTDSQPVILINKALAERSFPGEDPIGKHIKPGLSISGPSKMHEIVGIVGDVKHRALNRPDDPEAYMAEEQTGIGFMSGVVRTDAPTASLVPAIREIVASLDKDIPVYDIKTMDDYVAGSVAQPRLSSTLLGIFAALALVLAMVGIYGVMSFSVEQRTNEIGIRMTLGAQRADVLRLVLRQGMAIAAIGVTLGIGGALASSGLLKSLLFGVRPSDPATLIGVAILLVGCVLAACYIPARRAMRVDPIVALRYE